MIDKQTMITPTQITWVQKIGNFVSNLILGQTKEIIVRTDQRVLGLEETIKIITDDLKDVRERFSGLEGKTANLFQTKSPISLTDTGNKYLKESGFKDFIDSNNELLSAACSKDRKMKTPYDVQESVFDFFANYDFPTEILDKIKTYAFNQGINVDVMRRVGAIYFRDICLDSLGFSAEDLDKPAKP